MKTMGTQSEAQPATSIMLLIITFQEITFTLPGIRLNTANIAKTSN